MRIALQLAAAAVVSFLTLQAIYWPLIMKPGTELEFWQMRWAAELGYWVGLPVVAATLVSPFAGALQQLLVLILTGVWAAAAYWLVGYVLRRVYLGRRPSAT